MGRREAIEQYRRVECRKLRNHRIRMVILLSLWAALIAWCLFW